MTSALKKTIFISIFWHAAIFNIFGLTFGHRIVKVDFSPVSFLGSILNRADLEKNVFEAQSIKSMPNNSLKLFPIEKKNKNYFQLYNQHLKPFVALPSNQTKVAFATKTPPFSFEQRRNEPAIMLYPQLPYSFLLYFKDRQLVHIELMFNIMLNAQQNTILIKRKKSSGNLEADLLSMRYISHYLFIQQARFTPNSWQTVKIDLSARNE